jgi:hypothetical protein
MVGRANRSRPHLCSSVCVQGQVERPSHVRRPALSYRDERAGKFWVRLTSRGLDLSFFQTIKSLPTSRLEKNESGSGGTEHTDVESQETHQES